MPLESLSTLDPMPLLFKLVMGLWAATAIRSLVVPGHDSVRAPLWIALLVTICAAATLASGTPRIVLLVSAAMSLIGVVEAIRGWTKQSAADATGQAPRKNAQAQLGLIPATLSCVGFGLVFAALIVATPALAADIAWLAWSQAFSCSVMWGIALAVGLELTFCAVPSDLAAGSSRPVGRLATLAMVLALAMLSVAIWVAANIVLGDGPRSGQAGTSLKAEFQLLSWIFAGTILLVQFVVWMVPYRLFRLKDGLRKSEWSTLALSAWLGCLALSVALALPTSWPWTLQPPASISAGSDTL